MARPERKTVDYFPHYISDGKKMFFIEQKYGNDGYAVWFKILESLASTDDHFLNLNNQMDLLFLSAKCRISEQMLLNILDDLSVLGEVDKFLWMNRIVYSHKFIESIQDAYARRSNKCMSYESFCIHYSGLCTTITLLNFKKQYNNSQSKVKEIKPKENKEKESKLILFDSWWNLYEKKVGKDKAQPKWLTLSMDEINVCLEVVSKYVLSTPDKQFRKDPTTYLNGKHWNDEIIIKQPILNNGTTTEQPKRTLEDQANALVDRITSKYSNENATGANDSTTEDSHFEIVD
jgi:hypothetical protein